MDSMFKIECNGAFRAGRSLALLSSMLTHNIQTVDLSLVTTDGVTIPANRGLLALHSKHLAQVTTYSGTKHKANNQTNTKLDTADCIVSRITVL